MLILLPVFALQELCQHILFHQLKFPFVCHPKARIKPDVVKIVSDDKETEAVNGSDLRIVKKRCLLLQMGIIRLLFQLPINGAPDPLSHFRSGGIGKGHHEKPVNVNRLLLIQDHLNDTLHQNGSLSGTRRRRHQNIAVTKINYFLLLFRKFHSHFHASFAPFFSFCASQESFPFISLRILSINSSSSSFFRILVSYPGIFSSNPHTSL